MGSLRLERTAALGLIAVALGLALLLAAFPLPASAGTTTLHLTSGSATITRAGTAQAAADGETLREGDTVTSASGATALLAFADGSTLTLEPATTITVVEASAHPTFTVTRLVQTVGRTWSSVQRLATPRSRYEIRAPALTATVRGTAFEVEVGADGTTRVHTVEGAVSVANERGTVLVVAGTQTTATPTTAPVPPAAPPPAPQRTLQIGAAPIVVVDGGGRSCGRVEGAVLQQIPGCVVQGDEIRIVGAAASAELRQREVSDPAAATDIVIVTPRPTPLPTEEVRVPIIGVIPVQPARGTTVPIVAATGGPLVAPLLGATLPPIPTTAPLPSAAPSAAPTLAVPTPPSLPLVTAAPALTAPTPTLAVPTPAFEPLPLPTLAPTALPTIAPTAVPTVVPTVAPTAVPTVPPVIATPTPQPTAAPTPSPTPAPTAAPTATLTPVLPLPTPTLPLATPGVGLP